MSRPLWRPSQATIDQANITHFADYVRSEYKCGAKTYAALYQWSIERPEVFWPAVWAFCGIKASKTWDTVLEHPERMPGARWFTGSRLNFAENLLRYRDEHSAIIFCGEDGGRSELSYAELHHQVAKFAAALRAEGVGTGDRVAGFMPNLPETIIAMLAATSIGAVWSSCSPDFGVAGLLDRFGQIEPKVLITADGYCYNGKTIDSLSRVQSALEKLNSIARVVVVPFVDARPKIEALPRAIMWETFTHEAQEIEFAQLPFDHPIYIMYSSGTTGVPKCIVHGAGGTLIQHLKELVLHTDLKREDRICYFTTCGWMMWNWMVSSLAVGATVVLYDGAAFYPQPDALFQMIEQEGISVFGTSAKYLSAAEKAHVKPIETLNLSHLRAILSTGSPLMPENSAYVYRDIKHDLCLSSISGGTDIVSCFALGNPTLPVYPGELQCRGLGLQVKVFDEHAQPVREQKGELVCTAPFPTMPVYFWNDPDGERYRTAYFERFSGVWCHGDYALLTERGGLVIYGRSDAVLNPGGVRIGTAEIYRQVEKLDEILESIAIGQEWNNDVRVILFVRLREGVALDESLIERLRKTIRANTTPRHVPAKILAIPDIPRTISGKIVELAVTQIVHGRAVKNTDALANPDALEHYRDRPELQKD